MCCVIQSLVDERIMAEEELPTFEGNMTQIPATISRLLGLNPPKKIPPPIRGVEEFGSDHVILAIFDNFGLFECTYYKPKFLIKSSEAILVLNTEDPHTFNVLNEIVYGSTKKKKFHLMDFLTKGRKHATMIGRAEDLRMFVGKAEAKIAEDDMRTYIEAIKVINRVDFVWLHFLDFEAMYQKYNTRPPEEIAQKLITRTDNWILSLFKQAIPGTLLIVLGDHGRREIRIEYEGKYAKWREASVPIAIMMKK